ncbi:unnamed protein product [Phaeothamnion confervicola]
MYPETMSAFQNEEVRRQFVAKVFGIVFVQLAVTTVVVVACRWNENAYNYIRDNVWVYWTSWAVALATVLVLACGGEARRKYPMNYILLSLLTVAFSFLMAVITTFYDADVVAYALIITCGVVFACVLLACVCRLDFTKLYGVLMALAVALFIALIIGLFWANSTLYITIGALGAVLFSLFLIHDIQLVMGGRQRQIGPDEYIFAALMVYLDVINIFQYILLILGMTRG